MTLQIVVPGTFTAPGLPDLGILGFTDTFARADSDALGGTEKPKRPWLIWSAQPAVQAIVNQEAMVARSGTAGPCAAVADARTADGTVEVTLGFISGGQSGIVFRGASDGNYMRFAQNGGLYRLYKMVGNSATALGDTTGIVPAVGDVISVDFHGDQIDCYVNGAKRLTVTDSTHADATYCGFYNAGTTVNTIRDIAATG